MPELRTPAAVQDDFRLMTEARARQIYERIRGFQQGGGRLAVHIQSGWYGELRWARNRVTAASDRRHVQVSIARVGLLGSGRVTTNQVDDESLAAAVRGAERKIAFGGFPEPRYDGLGWKPPLLPLPDTSIWSDATYAVTPRERSALAQALVEEAEAQQLLSSGFLQMRVSEGMSFGEEVFEDIARAVSPDDTRREGTGAKRVARDAGYQRHTESQCSMTVRHPKGAGSGWAGLSSYDWSAIDARALATKALDNCVRSLNPVAIEPGRYTTILHPQAVAQLTESLIASLNAGGMARRDNENPNGFGIFSLDVDPALGRRRTKIGLKIIDERISISHDPMSPQLGIVPALGLGAVTWVEHGVLKTLAYNRDKNIEDYGVVALNENLPMLGRGSYAMTGGSTTLEEMIASTKRGVVVSRFSNLTSVRNGWLSLLNTGVTRDGLWLVENGKISKAVKNMRFTDSPLFMLNNVVQLGVPVPVFHPGDHDLHPAIVPSLKVNDFAFTATADAV